MPSTIYFTDEYSGGRPASRALLKQAIARHAGTAPEDLTVLEEPGGKPYVPGGPEFSVSHSGSCWAVLFADAPCGLDIQLPRRADHEAIARRLFSPREADLVRVQGEDAFFRLWTRREALVKCAGQSVFSEDVPELLIPPETGVVRVRFGGADRAVMDADPGRELPEALRISIALTVEEAWTPGREVPLMKRLVI